MMTNQARAVSLAAVTSALAMAACSDAAENDDVTIETIDNGVDVKMGWPAPPPPPPPPPTVCFDVLVCDRDDCWLKSVCTTST